MTRGPVRRSGEEGREVVRRRPAGTATRPGRRRAARSAAPGAPGGAACRARSAAPISRQPPARPVRAEARPGKALAQWVMLPAPRQTTRSPGRAMPRTSGRAPSGPSRARASRWPWLAQASDQRIAVGTRRSAPRRRHRPAPRAPCRRRGSRCRTRRTAILSRLIAVRLDDRHDPARGRGAGRREDGPDLDRMMAVVVDHGDAADRADAGEAALDPAQACRAPCGCNALSPSSSSRAMAIAASAFCDVVPARAAPGGALHPPLRPVPALRGRPRRRRSPSGSSTGRQGADVGLRAEAIGDDAAVGDPAVEGLDLRVVDAQHGEAIERQAPTKPS